MARDDHPRIPELPPSPLSPEELDERWFQACERRMPRVESGEDRLIPWEEAEKFIFSRAKRRQWRSVFMAPQDPVLLTPRA